MELVCASELTLCAFPVPLKPQLHSRIRIIPGGFRLVTALTFGTAHIIFRRQIICSQSQITIDNSSVRQGIISIELDRVPKVPNRPLDSTPRISTPVMAPFEIRLIRFGIFRVSSRNALLFISTQFQLQGGDNLSGYAVLDFKQIAILRVKALTPKLPARRRIHQFNINHILSRLTVDFPHEHDLST